MTYSIVAVDRDADEIGVAVQTCWPGVGASVPWLEPGVGAIATQSFTNIALGPQGLARLRDGIAAPDVLHDVLSADLGREVRQVGIVDMEGRSAAHTGSGCIPEAGHVCEPGVTVQANTLERSHVWNTMLEAFRAAPGDLADRLMAALQAADRDGGDLRGSRSAALVVAPGTVGAPSWARRYDIRIDQADDPVGELKQQLRIARAYEALDVAVIATEAHDVEVALDGTTRAYGLAPDDAQVAFWHAMVLSASGRPDEAQPIMDDALRAEPRLSEYRRRLLASGHASLLDPAP